MNLAFFRRSVGAKIALATTVTLLFVTGLFLLIFALLDVTLLSALNLVQLILLFVLLLVFVEVILVMLTTGIFVDRPLQKLRNMMRIAEEGNFLVRADVDSVDELGVLAGSFNRMLSKITDLEARKIETERELIAAHENLKYKKELEEKAAIIESTNSKLHESLKDLKILYQTSQNLSPTLELSELLHTVTRILTETLNYREFSLLFLDERRECLEVVAAHGFRDNARIHGLKFKVGEGISGMVAQSGRTIHIQDTTSDPRYLHYKGEKTAEGSFLSIPLVTSGEVVGVLNVGDSKKGAFSLTDVQSLESVANQIAIAYDRSRLYMKTKELSITDELTGVHNRRHFQQVLHMEWKRATRFIRPVSVLMIDVDYFKRFNDTYGHLKGDQALKNLACLLSENLREVDTVARFGGEEFVVLLADTRLKEALLVAEKLRRLIQDRSGSLIPGSTTSGLVPPGPPSLTVSIGVSAFPDTASGEEDLINTADIALYRAKDEGRNRVVGYSDSLSRELRVVSSPPEGIANRKTGSQ
ncbi:MAG: diguanylate cyclase [Deltaproteobacteria bacterium]|nr:diguanylate cyclase [Deltaproteobacteria bacterium]